MMTDVFLTFVEISISASLIIVLLMAFTPFFNKRYASKWKYWIWIFLALRLIIPFNAVDGKSVVDALMQMKTQIVMNADKNHTDHVPGQTAVPRRVMIEVPAQMTAPITMKPEKADSSITMLDIVAFVWLIGALVFLSVHLIGYLRYKSQVTKQGTVVKDTHVLRQLFELKRELHIKCTVRVIEYSESASPMMTGFLKPVLILPEEQYSSEELFFILKHELVHLSRKDVYVKLLFVVSNAIHWFNPFVWIMQKEAAVDMELSCDERVMRGANYATRKAYTETLLSTLHKQCTKKNLLSTQFYGGKQIMQKRFKNIFLKSRRKNGTVILVFAVVLTVSLGTMIGCSVGKENIEGVSEGTENNSQPEENELSISYEDSTEDELSAESASTTDAVAGENAANNTRILTIMKEGEPEEKQATLVVDQVIYDEFSFYLPDGEWQKEGAAMWHAVVNENVRLWVTHFEKDYHIERIFADDGFEEDNGELVRQEDGIIYKIRLYEEGDYVWCVEYCYPIEAEEGWGRELPVIADTFAVIAPVDIIHGYITVFDESSVTIDRQLWVTPESEEWKPEYNEAAGFEVVDAEGEDITYPLHEECTFVVLENHYDPTIELSREEFANYLTEMEYPVLWIIELEDGQIRSVTEQYLP